jgi:hypothetical protein
MGSPFLPAVGRDIEYFQFAALVSQPDYEYGRIFPGAVNIIAHLADGHTIPAMIDGDLFMIWPDTGRTLGSSIITARSQDATVIDGNLYSHPIPTYSPSVVDSQCRTLIHTLVTEPAGRTVLKSVSANSIRPAATDDGHTRLYAVGDLLVPCDLDPADRLVLLGSAILPDRPDTWHPGGHVEIMTGGNGMDPHRGEAFGIAPIGLTALTLHLSDGQAVPATISGGYFFAGWQVQGSTVVLESATATVNGVQLTVGPDGTVSGG